MSDAGRARPCSAVEDHDARRCAVCGARFPAFGYGPPLAPRGMEFWACGADRGAVEARLRRRDAAGPAGQVPKERRHLL